MQQADEGRKGPFPPGRAETTVYEKRLVWLKASFNADFLMCSAVHLLLLLLLLPRTPYRCELKW